jgi:hypothetical protein
MKPLQAIVLPPEPTRRRRRMPQFTIFGLMVLTFVASIGFSQLYYWSRVAQGDHSAAPIAILLAVALPMLVMTIFSLGLSVKKWLRRR